MNQNRNMFNLLLTLIRQRRSIFWITLLVAVGSVIYSLITPIIWKSQASFYSIDSQDGLSTVGIGDVGGLASTLLGSGLSDQSQNCINAMNSRTFSEDVIRRFKLIDYFNIETPDSLKAMDMALLQLRKKVVSVFLNPETRLITVSAYTKNKSLSKQIAEYYLIKLAKYNQDNKLNRGKINRVFLENRTTEVKTAIDSLSIALKDFQKQHKAIDLDTQLRSTVNMYAETVAQKMQADIIRAMASQTYAQGSPMIKELEQKQHVLADKIRELESKSTNLQPKYMLQIDQIPDISLQYSQLLLNLEIQKKVFEFLYPQFEAARIEEMKDMPTLEIVDNPREAGLRAKPRRAVLCITITLLGFLLSLIYAFVADYFQNHKAEFAKARQQDQNSDKRDQQSI